MCGTCEKCVSLSRMNNQENKIERKKKVLYGYGRWTIDFRLEIYEVLYLNSKRRTTT